MFAEVNWELAPEGAEFYAMDYFRDHQGRWWDEEHDIWKPTLYTLEHLQKEKDYRKLPISIPEEATQWTAKHYDNYYQLTPKDIEAGKVKIDAYFVNKLWQLNSKDDTGALFHCLKTIARFGDKNPIERELNALHNQVKRMAELYGVTLK
jgi:hypothetical protein